MALETITAAGGGMFMLDMRPRVMVAKPCGHRWRYPESMVDARAQYVCGICDERGHLDPEWVVVEAPVRVQEPPPGEAAPSPPTREERINAGMDHIRALIAAEGMCSTDRFDANRPPLAYSSGRHLDYSEDYETWNDLVSDLGGRVGPSAAADLRWERNRPLAFALLGDLWDMWGRPPYITEYADVARAAGLPAPTTLQKREGLSWHGLINRLAEERMARRDAAA